MMSRRGRRAGTRPLKRRVGTRRPRKTLVIFCEGERTEPEYLDALKRQPSVRDVAAVDLRVETGKGGSVPGTLVAMATEARSRAINEEAEIDEFWCVFGVEWPRNHPGLREAIQQARTNGIKLAISNPCFELWLILHFQDHSMAGQQPGTASPPSVRRLQPQGPRCRQIYAPHSECSPPRRRT
jgi:hypothetical protein